MVGLNEPELFDRLKCCNFKVGCLEVLAALLCALPLYVNLTPYIPLESENEIKLLVSTEADASLSQYQLYKFVPSIQNWLNFSMLRVPNPFLQAIVCVCELKTALQAIGQLKSRSAYNHSITIFFT